MSIFYNEAIISATSQAIISSIQNAGNSSSSGSPKGVESFKLSELDDFRTYKNLFYGSVRGDWNVSLKNFEYDGTRFSRKIDQLERPAVGWWGILHKSVAVDKGRVIGSNQMLNNYRFADSNTGRSNTLQDSPNVISYSGYGAAGTTQQYQDTSGRLKGDELLLFLEPGVGCEIEFVIMVSRTSTPEGKPHNMSIVGI